MARLKNKSLLNQVQSHLLEYLMSKIMKMTMMNHNMKRNFCQLENFYLSTMLEMRMEKKVSSMKKKKSITDQWSTEGLPKVYRRSTEGRRPKVYGLSQRLLTIN